MSSPALAAASLLPPEEIRPLFAPEQVWIVIAAYNEERSIERVVRDVRTRYPNVVVVDDGSRDATAGRAQDAGAVVVRHAVNLGQGAALQTGISFALVAGADYIVTFDADGQHRSNEIARLVNAVVSHGADIACGSRFLGTAINLPLARRIMLKLAVLFTTVTTGRRMSDAHNGFRAMTRSCAHRIRIRQNRMAHASEIIEQIGRHKLTCVEVPVTIEYTAYSLAKGQKMGNALNIVLDLLFGRLQR